MSIRVMAAIWDRCKQRQASRLLAMLAIADNANDEGWAYPSQKTIAKKCRVTPRTLRNTLDELEQADELIIYNRVNPANPEQHYSNVYHLAQYGDPKANPPIDLRGQLTPRKVERRDTGDPTSTGIQATLPVEMPATVEVGLPATSESSIDSSLDQSPQKDSPPKAGGEPKPRDLIFDAVALHIFGIEDAGAEGGRIGKISNWLKGTYEGKGKERVGKLSKPAEVIHIELFAAYCRHEGFTPPLDFVKFVEHWRKWSTIIRAQSAGAGKKVMTLEEYEQLLEEEGADG